MGAIGKFLMALERLTGVKALGELGRPLVQMDSQKRQFEAKLAQKKSEINSAKKAFEDIKPKSKSS